jgi:hypothetical protein
MVAGLHRVDFAHRLATGEVSLNLEEQSKGSLCSQTLLV